MATSTINGANPCGSFTAIIPRLNNQAITFYYKEIAPNCCVAQASFTANSSTSNDQLFIDTNASSFPFSPSASMGRFTYQGVQGICARRTPNNNMWLETATGAQVSGKSVLISLIFWR